MNKYYEHYKESKEIIKEYLRLGNLGKFEEQKELLLEGIKKYPNNICIKDKMMEIYFKLWLDNRENTEYLKTLESIALELKENEIYKYNAIATLAYLYRRLDRQDEIKEDVNNLPSIYQCREILMPEVLKWGERIKAVQENFTLLIELFDRLLLSTFGREEVGKRDIILLKEKTLIDAVFENGDYGIYNHNLQNIYYRCARDQAYVQNKEKVLEYLNECIKYTYAYDELRFKTKIEKHTSFLVDRLTTNIEEYNFSSHVSLTDFMKEELNDELFDFIRKDAEFIEIVEELSGGIKA